LRTREKPVEIVGELRVVTDASVWLIRPATYLRMPKTAQARGQPRSPALTDNRWHAHEGAWIVSNDAGELWLRIVPAGRIPGAHGIETGFIVTASASLGTRAGS
jgi:hypothetical protein